VLTLIVFLPLVGAILCALLPKDRPTWPRAVATAITAIDLALVGWVVYSFVPGGGFQFVEKVPWVPAVHINYTLALDGMSLPLLFLSAATFFLDLIASYMIYKKP